MRAGEAEVNSQYDTTIIAGKGRRHSDGGKGLGKGLGMGALLRCAAIWLVLAFAFAAALARATAQAQQKITFANARTVTVGKSQDVHTEILNDQGFSYMLRGDYARAHKKLEEARVKEPSNPYVQANMQLLEESYRNGRAIQ